MKKSKVIIISDSKETIDALRAAAVGSRNTESEVYSQEQWQEMTKGTLLSGDVELPATTLLGGKLIPFPSQKTDIQVDRVRTMAEVELEQIRLAIAQANGNLTLAAKDLGIGRATLYRKLKNYNIDATLHRNKKVA